MHGVRSALLWAGDEGLFIILLNRTINLDRLRPTRGPAESASPPEQRASTEEQEYCCCQSDGGECIHYETADITIESIRHRQPARQRPRYGTVIIMH